MRDMHGHLKNLKEVDHAGPLSYMAAEDLRLVRPKSLYERRLKRSLDIVGGILIGGLVLPVALLIALAIRIGLGKGIFYSQRRVGMDGSPFVIWKFRTMRPDRRKREIGEIEEGSLDSDRRTAHKNLDDPRHTGLGRTLRRLSLDELPQLVNVLRGEMSLVGPRPELVGVASERGYLDHVRHEVRPGMTGPYQVSELRLNGDLRDGLELDEEYVQNLTLRTDLRCLIGTVGVMLGRSSGS